MQGGLRLFNDLKTKRSYLNCTRSDTTDSQCDVVKFRNLENHLSCMQHSKL